MEFSTYTTLDGDVFDLSGLKSKDRDVLDEAVAAFEADIEWVNFGIRFTGPKSPILKDTGGRVTRAVWATPLYQALHDLDDRLGIRQGTIATDGNEDVIADPFADEWMPSTVAASDKGVTLMGLHGAIERGNVIARPIHEGGSRIEVSRRSLDRWQPRRSGAKREPAPTL